MTFIRLTAAAALVSVCAGPAMAQTADEIVERHIAALGGREALSRIRTRVSTGTITLTLPVGTISGTVEAFAKAPNKSRMIVKLDLSGLGGGEILNDQRFDGTTAFVIDTFNGNRDISGTQLEAMKNNGFPTAFLDYRARGHAIAVIGNELLGGRPTYLLEVTPKIGPKARSWVDAETYMVVKTSVTVEAPQVGVVEQVTEFSDFRTVDGVKVPFSVKSVNQVQTTTAVLTDVKHNVDIDDGSFVKPAKL